MEHEEREEIPWSSLVAQVEEEADRRWYFVAVAVGLVVLAFAGIRFLSQNSGAELPPDSRAESIPSSTTVGPSEPSLVIAEDDLTTVEPLGTMPIAARAEWFVSDFFTVDGSQATLDSLRSALAAGLADADLPHDAEGVPITFVEWARATDVREVAPGSFEVDVAYRAITEVTDGFERAAVDFVRLSISVEEGVPVVTALPVAVDPWPG